MPDLVAGDLVEATFRYHTGALPGNVYVNRVHMEVVDAGGGGQVSEAFVAGGLSQWWSTQFRLLLSSSTSYDNVLVQSFQGGVRSAGSLSVQNAGPGARSALLSPPQDAVVIRKRTAFAGRAYRGRIFIPGMAQGDVEAGLVATVFKTAFAGTDIINGFENGVNTGIAYGEALLRFIVAQTPPGGVPIKRATCVTAALDAYCRSQRRRQIGKGS